jgi:AAA+ superfamily predicted ATPase
VPRLADGRNLEVQSMVPQSVLWSVIVVLVGVIAAFAIAAGVRRWKKPPPSLSKLVEEHFRPIPLGSLTISERQFPHRVRADLQRAIDRLFDGDVEIRRFCGIRKEYAHDGVGFSSVITDSHNQVSQTPAQYEDVDVGDEMPVRCLKNGLWLLREKDIRYAVMFGPAIFYGQMTGIHFEVATPNDAEGIRIAQRIFKSLEDAVRKADSYRGKILSLERKDSYTGRSSGISVHKLRTVRREQVILPRTTLELLERNVVNFVRQREKLRSFKQATKKGLLFYGPPGTGKTHTIHYLCEALEGHTTLLISAEQMTSLDEYMLLARLLQPSIVVLEDVDLIARDREGIDGPCQESLLNKLLNEMDGLKEEADILFILTTNRPESLERALSARPGRVDQAIEFPLPDDGGREKLVRLYSEGVEIPQDVVQAVVKRTDRVSAAFIKELMRRSLQFHLERGESGRIDLPDVEKALEEMLFVGGSLNLKILGAERAALGIGPLVQSQRPLFQ